MARLDDVLERWKPDDSQDVVRIETQAAIREAYRIGHDDGRHARLPHGEPTFIDKLRSNADAAEQP